MSIYLDASILLPTIVEEPASDIVDAFLSLAARPLWVSEFAAAEVASGLSRHVRTGRLDAPDAIVRLADFDDWRITETSLVDVDGADIRASGIIVRRFELMLRTPDALHVAICRRLGASLATFDKRMAGAARALGVTVVAP